VILLVLAVLLAGLAWWQRNNIQAVFLGLTNSRESLEEQMQKNEQEIKDAVGALTEVTIRDVTEEERQALRDGTLDSEELVDLLTSGKPPEPPAQEEAAEEREPLEQESVLAASSDEVSEEPLEQEPAPPEPSDEVSEQEPAAESSYEKQLNTILARFYVLREEYLIALNQMELDAELEWNRMSGEQRADKAGLVPVIERYLEKAVALEAECDAKMDAIVKELRALLKEYGQPLDLIQKVRYNYADEKSLKKAWYLAKLDKWT